MKIPSWMWLAGAGLVLAGGGKKTSGGGGSGGGGSGGGGGGQPPPAGECIAGAYVRSLLRGTAQDLDTWVTQAGLQALDVQLLAQHETDSDRTKVFVTPAQATRVAAMRAKGVRVEGYMWIEPDGEDQAVEVIEKALELWDGGLDRVCLNAEKPWYPNSSKGRAPLEVKARRYVDAVASTGVDVGLTTYGGGPSFHPNFPWGGFTDVSYVVPQWYNSKHTLADGYERRFRDNWEKLFPRGSYGWQILLGASNKHSPAQMAAALLRARQACPWVSEFFWWDLYWLSLNKSRREAVAGAC